ncbi:MAG: YidC/Oxa1 family membrane protein insertase [Firmicutes bacterium]|nr:YidC/Oxa1 family membrane protein insertase [Bacillota bacterium]
MGIIDLLAKGILALLNVIVEVTNNYGLAIILVTILSKIVLFPLTLKSNKSMAAMRALQPKIQEIQEKHKDDPKELNIRLGEFYKEHNLNPLGGCLPVLLQFPILFGFLRALQSFGENAEAAKFLGIWTINSTVMDISGPLASIPVLSLLLGILLPLLAALTTYLQMSMSTTDPSQRGMMMIMPIMIGVLSFRFSVGLIIYWIVGNIISIAQQYWINKQFPYQQQGGQTK